MRRSFVRLGTILLAVATGAALAATAGFFDESTSRDSEAVAGAAAVRQFYAAVDDVLRTGDGTLLAGALAPDFVDHGAAPGLPGTADGLVRELVALRATFPHLQLVPEAVTAEGDRVAVRVEVAGENAASFLGLSLGSMVAPWGELDLFRVAAGKIVERWGTPAPAVLEPLGTAPLGPSPPAPQVVGLARLTFRPGAVYLDLADSVRLLYLEAGTLAVTTADADGGTPTVGAGDNGAGPSQLVAPTSLPLSAGFTYTFRNEGAEPAVATVAAVCDPQAPGRTAPGTGISMTAIWLSCDPDAQGQPASGAGADAGDAGSTQLPGGVVLQPMAGDQTAILPPDSATIALGRVALAPGADLPLSVVAGPIMIFVEAGDLDLTTGAAEAWVRRATTGRSGDAVSPALATGDGALVPAGTDLGVRNRTSSVVTVVLCTIVPTEPGPGSG